MRVLEEITVLDFTQFIAGPYCASLLADMGAKVIRMERPGGAEDRKLGPFPPNEDISLRYIALSRNKKSITLNLQSGKGQEIFRDLVKHVDVVLTSFPLNAINKMKIDYDTLSKINPSIIVSHISAFGMKGPYAERNGFDVIIQGMTGSMSITGYPDNPPVRSPVPYVDYATGTKSALGIMLALYHRERTGVGQMIDVSLFQTALTFMLTPINEFMKTGKVRTQVGNAGWFSLNDMYETKDGYVILSIIGDYIWKRFCRLIEREDLIDDPRFKTDMERADNYDSIKSIIEEWVAKLTTSEAIEQFEKERVPCAPVLSYTDVSKDPHVEKTNLFVDVEYPGVGGVPAHAVPIYLSKTPGEIRTPAPTLGQDNEEVYCNLLKHDRNELKLWEKEGII